MKISATLHGDLNLEHQFHLRHAVLASAAAIGLAVTPRARQLPLTAATAVVEVMAPEWRETSVSFAVSVIEAPVEEPHDVRVAIPGQRLMHKEKVGRQTTLAASREACSAETKKATNHRRAK